VKEHCKPFQAGVVDEESKV